MFLAAREVMLCIVKFLRSEVSAEVGRVFLLIVFVHCRNNALVIKKGIILDLE